MTFSVEDNRLHLHIDAPHQQVLPYYPQYNIYNKTNLAIEDYNNPQNCVGHQQRAYLNYWAIRSFVESKGGIGLDVGSAGVEHVGCLSTDKIGNGETPEYGGVMQGVHLKIDANDLSVFGSDAFSCLISNHVVEHLQCSRLQGWEKPEDKYRLNCDASELQEIFRNHWIRVVRPGGYIVGIFPDEDVAAKNNSSILFYDPHHMHRLGSKSFFQNVLNHLRDVVQILEYDTLKNGFSINFSLQKK